MPRHIHPRQRRCGHRLPSQQDTGRKNMEVLFPSARCTFLVSSKGSQHTRPVACSVPSLICGALHRLENRNSFGLSTWERAMCKYGNESVFQHLSNLSLSPTKTKDPIRSTDHQLCNSCFQPAGARTRQIGQDMVPLRNMVMACHSYGVVAEPVLLHTQMDPIATSHSIQTMIRFVARDGCSP